MIANPLLFEMFDLSPITTIVSGSAPLDKSLADRLHALRPTWRILGAYGTNRSLRGLCLLPGGDSLLTHNRPN
jgi:hypothetical protein